MSTGIMPHDIIATAIISAKMRTGHRARCRAYGQAAVFIHAGVRRCLPYYGAGHAVWCK